MTLQGCAQYRGEQLLLMLEKKLADPELPSEERHALEQELASLEKELELN